MRADDVDAQYCGRCALSVVRPSVRPMQAIYRYVVESRVPCVQSAGRTSLCLPARTASDDDDDDDDDDSRCGC